MALNTIGNTGTSNAASAPAAPKGVPASAGKGPVVAVVSEAAPQQQQPKPEQVQKAMESMKQLVETRAPNSLSFSIDDATGKTVVKVSDANTGEIIRQIPSEELLDIARSLDKLQGMLLRDKA